MSKELYIPWEGWHIIKRLGNGSYGSVYEIQRQIYGETESAAVKILNIPKDESEVELLRASGYDDVSIRNHFEDSIEAIIREYGLMAKVKGNANVVYCDDFKSIPHESGFGSTIYIKMELLTPVLRAMAPLSAESSIIKFGLDMSSALVTCETRGILHRDIKPQNIFVSSDGTYKLGDFGIARTLEDNGSLTAGIGTYNYMAPEVYNKQHYDHRADIYSLGIVLYWLLNECRLPFYPAQPQVITPECVEEARQRRFRGDSLPAPKNGSHDLQQIVLKACAHDPRNRYQSAQELHNDLNALVNGFFIAAQDTTANETEGTILDDLPERVPTESRSQGKEKRDVGKYQKSKKKNKGVRSIAIFVAAFCLVAVLIFAFAFSKADTDGDDLSYPNEAETMPPEETASAYDILLQQALSDGPDHVQRMRDGTYTESFLDEHDNVLCVLYRDLDGTVLKKFTAEYNDDNKLLCQLSYDASDTLVSVENISYTENGDILNREIKLGDGSIYRSYIFQYRADGKMEGAIVYDGNGSVLEQTVYHFEGNIPTGFITTSADGSYSEGVTDENGCAPNMYYYESDGTLIFRTENTFDEEGREILAIYYNPDDTVRFTNVTDYNAIGEKTRYTCSGPDGEIVFWNEFSYDALGRVCNMKNYANGGENYYFYEYTSDITDKTIRETCYAKDGSYTIKHYNVLGNEQELFAYDEGGRTVGYEEYEYDALQNFIGYSATEYYTDGSYSVTQYNSDREYTKVVFYNADKTILSRREVSFDDSGRPVKEVTTQSDGFLSDLAVFTYEEGTNLVSLCVTTYSRDGSYKENHFRNAVTSNIRENIFNGFNNNMVLTKMYDADGNLVSETEYTYTEDKPGMTVRFTDHSDGGVTVSDVNENNQIVTQSAYDSNGYVIGILEYLYNDLGQNIRINHKRPDGYTYSYVEYKYDANGEVIDTKWYMPG